MKTLNDSLEFVNTARDEEELRKLNRYIIARLKQLRSLQAEAIKEDLEVGQLVGFTVGLSQGRGRRKLKTTVTGRITDVKQKYAHVRVAVGPAPGHYRVPMASLTIMEG